MDVQALFRSLVPRHAGWWGGFALACALSGAPALAKQVVTIGIGTQNTTTNTVTGGVVMKELGLFEKFLPKDGRYADVEFKLDWQNFTSGPPIINGMMADRLQIGMMGDYPLLMAGASGQASQGNETLLIAVIAYNAHGSGNGLVVHADSDVFELADLKGRNVSVPFGSAAHGMLLQAMQSRGWPEDYWNLSNQSPEVGTTNLQEKRIDGHANFVPFADLLPYRGYARKIFDGAQTGVPTFHGVTVRKDFAERYPEVIIAYIRALMAANDWVREQPAVAAERIEAWTRIEREVAYLYLGPNGIHTLDPTLKPQWLAAIDVAHGVLRELGRVKAFDRQAWVEDRFVRAAYEQAGRDYEAGVRDMGNAAIAGHDPYCNVAVTEPRQAGEIWVKGEAVVPASSVACTLAGVRAVQAGGKTLGAAYVMDHQLGIKLFADKAFYVLAEDGAPVPFLLRGDAQAYAGSQGGRVVSFDEAVKAAAQP